MTQISRTGYKLFTSTFKLEIPISSPGKGILDSTTRSRRTICCRYVFGALTKVASACFHHLHRSSQIRRRVGNTSLHISWSLWLSPASISATHKPGCQAAQLPHSACSECCNPRLHRCILLLGRYGLEPSTFWTTMSKVAWKTRRI
jgi:hypothetical protein